MWETTNHKLGVEPGFLVVHQEYFIDSSPCEVMSWRSSQIQSHLYKGNEESVISVSPNIIKSSPILIGMTNYI